MCVFQGADQLVGLIMEERRELEEEVWALRSFVLLARLKVHEAKQEAEKASCERDVVVENVTKLETNYKWRKRKLEKARQEVAFLKGDLAKTQEKVGCSCLEAQLREKERDWFQCKLDECERELREVRVLLMFFAKTRHYWSSNTTLMLGRTSGSLAITPS